MKKSLRMKTGDLSSYLYFKVLNSQECNIRFFRALVGEIFKIIYEETKDFAVSLQKTAKNSDDEEKHVAFENDNSDDSINENYKRIMKISDTAGYALDFKSLEEMDNPSPDIQRLIINRKKKFDRVGNKIIELVIGALRHLPKFR
mmetsp:Transcript_14192/g.2278  ORF Transcript_14192/g.2278 Transcript_14192/m.2278 type:complete len:145 (-) Transcript_14192:1725-2159(-)